MYIFISDLHLTDGTFDYVDPNDKKNNVSHDISVAAFKLFWDNINRIVKANENSIDEITLVLLGDILEMRSTTKWVESDYHEAGKRELKHRPWNENPDNPSETCKKIIEDILTHNEESLRYLNIHRLNDVDKESGLYQLAVERNIKIRIDYVVGNHDRVINFHKDDSLRKLISDKLGWDLPSSTGSEPRRFKFLLKDENIGISAQHGHFFDTIDFFEDPLSPPIGALLSDVFGRVMHHVKKSGNKELIKFCMNIDNVRPSSDRFVWILSNLPDDESSLNQLRSVLITIITELKDDSKEILDFLSPRITPYMARLKWYLKAFLGVAGIFTEKKKLFVKLMKKMVLKLVDDIEEKLHKPESEEPLHEILAEVGNKVSFLGDDKDKQKEKTGRDQDFHYFEAALEEITTSEIDSPLKYVIYGHTHRYKLIPLITMKETDKEKKTFYFNSGTWKRTVQKNKFPRNNAEFQNWERMTYINFFNAEAHEVKDHIFDLWHGNLKTKTQN